MRVLIVLLTLISLHARARADPVFFTFEGTINEVSDAGGVAASSGLGIGSTVTYVFAVDFAADGFTVGNNASISVRTDDALNHYFFADFVSGTLLQQNAVFFGSPFANIIEQNFGREKVVSGVVLLGRLTGNGHLETTNVESYDTRVSDWAIGTTVFGYDQTYNAAGSKSYVRSILSVTSISESAPNPISEPAALALLGAALGVVGLYYRRKFKLAG